MPEIVRLDTQPDNRELTLAEQQCGLEDWGQKERESTPMILRAQLRSENPDWPWARIDAEVEEILGRAGDKPVRRRRRVKIEAVPELVHDETGGPDAG